MIGLFFALTWPAISIAGPDEAADIAQIEACVRTYAKDAPQERVIEGCVRIVESACDGKTTIGISECIMRETRAWDHLLNAWWTPLKAQAQASGEWDRLLAAQRQWIRDRDAECARVYDEWRDGSIRVIFAAACQRDLTAQRAVAFYYRLHE